MISGFPILSFIIWFENYYSPNERVPLTPIWNSLSTQFTAFRLHINKTVIEIRPHNLPWKIFLSLLFSCVVAAENYFFLFSLSLIFNFHTQLCIQLINLSEEDNSNYLILEFYLHHFIVSQWEQFKRFWRKKKSGDLISIIIVVTLSRGRISLLVVEGFSHHYNV